MRRHEVPGRCPSGAGPEVPGSWTRAQPRRCWGWQGTRAGRSAGRMPAGAGERARPRDSRYKSAPDGRSAPAAPPRWPRSRPAPGFSQPPTCGCGGRPPLPGSTMTGNAPRRPPTPDLRLPVPRRLPAPQPRGSCRQD